MYLEQLKHDLKRRMDWNNMKAFQTIDNRGEGVLNYNNIMNFCRMNSFRASEAEVIAIVRRLDVDADSCITFQEWNEMLQNQEELSAAIHGLAPTVERLQDHEDPYFRHTSPSRSFQTRSPQRGPTGQDPRISQVVSPQRLH